MKIDNSLKPTVPPTTGGVKAKPSSNAAAGSDEVRLSALAGELQSGDTEPPVNSARVAEIRQAIADGRFSIDAGAIADRLIATARELVTSQRKA